MQDDTAAWLEPMLEAAHERDDIDPGALMLQAAMPAAEAGTAVGDWLAQVEVPGVEHRAIDWVRFGNLLRSRLGWDDTYPDHPAARVN